MEKLIEIYHDIFPQTGIADWYYAFFGLLFHAVLKLKNVTFERFKWKVFLGQFLPVWFFSLCTIVILLGALPQVLVNYSILDSALIGYSSSSLFKQLLKNRLGNLNVFE